MVVDGTTQFVGNDSSLGNQAIQKSLTLPKVPVRISGISLDPPHTLQAHVEANALPEAPTARKASIYLVVALNHAESQLLPGATSAPPLTHSSVIQRLT